MFHERYNYSSSGSSGMLPPRISKSAPCSPVKPLIKRPPIRSDSFHVIHKVPVGDSPYVRAKHVQLVDKEPDRAIALFWAAINAGDRVDSALKDMAIVMKQQNRPEEAIEAIKSLRSRCSDQAQESLDNVLLDLYKRCGRLDDQIALLKHKLQLIYAGLAFNGKRTKTARSQGKKFQVSIEQEATRLLGNLGWAYMQQADYIAAEAVYRKALSMEPDNNKVCNLGICLMKQGRIEEAKRLLQSVTPASSDARWGADSHLKSYERAQEMLREIEASKNSSVAAAPKPMDNGFAALDVRRPLEQQLNLRQGLRNIPSYDSWEYVEDEEGDDMDENSNVNIQQHAETLKKKLELLCLNNTNNVNNNPNKGITNTTYNTNTMSNNGINNNLFNNNNNVGNGINNNNAFNNGDLMNNNANAPAGAAAPFHFSPNKPPRCITRPPSTARRSLSLESFDNLTPSMPSLQQNNAIATAKAASPIKQPFHELHFLPSASGLGDLGFIQSPTGASAAESSSLQQQLQQHIASSRRLRVFQDITTSPLAR